MKLFTRSIALTFLLCLACLAASAQTSPRRATVKLKQGDSITGAFIKADTDGVQIEVGGSRLTFKLDEVVNIAFGSDSTSAGSESAVQTARPAVHNSPGKPSVRKQTLDGFTFELEFCRASEGGVRCEFVVRNVADQTRNFYWDGRKTRLFDESGREYIAKSLSLGAKKNDTSLWYELLRDQPTRAIVTFNALPAEARKVSLNIHCGEMYRRRQQGDVVFKDVELVR